jgi:hypothetical protein
VWNCEREHEQNEWDERDEHEDESECKSVRFVRLQCEIVDSWDECKDEWWEVKKWNCKIDIDKINNKLN